MYLRYNICSARFLDIRIYQLVLTGLTGLVRIWVFYATHDLQHSVMQSNCPEGLPLGVHYESQASNYNMKTVVLIHQVAS